MRRQELTVKEKKTLYGIVRYPQLTDQKIAEKLGLKHSTITSIRLRLKEKEFFRRLIIPYLQDIGCQMLAVIYTSFNPLIPLTERVEITGKTIEVFDEIFFSVGEQDKGFSLSFSQDYATVGRINDIRTKIFGGRGLLEDEYPNMVLFPFDISKIYRFFDVAPLLKKAFQLDDENEKKKIPLDFVHTGDIAISSAEKNVFCMLVCYPEMSDIDIGKQIGVSRHTVSRLRRRFEQHNLLKTICLPNLQKLGFEILTFYHIRFDPRNPPNLENDDPALLISDAAIFFASRMFEAVMVSIYQNYDDYKTDLMKIMHVLKENHWICQDPIIRTYSLHTLAYIKDFKLAPITHKIVGCDVWMKKLLNM